MLLGNALLEWRMNQKKQKKHKFGAFKFNTFVVLVELSCESNMTPVFVGLARVGIPTTVIMCGTASGRITAVGVSFINPILLLYTPVKKCDVGPSMA